RPSVSSANTAARFPTVPRATWLDMTMTARGGACPASSMMSAAARHEADQPPHEVDEECRTQPAADARAPELGPVAALRVAAGHVASDVVRGAARHRRLALGADAADDAARFGLIVFVPAHPAFPDRQEIRLEGAGRTSRTAIPDASF